jgi:addiction module HigA family antidote
MPMFDPPHPGEIVREEVLGPLGLNLTQGARILQISPRALSKLVREQAPISADMAIRLEKAFGSSAEMWLGLQTTFDLAQARRREGEITVLRYLARDEAQPTPDPA